MAYILAFFAGILITAPNLYLMFTLDSEYKGIYMMNSDAEAHYLARMTGCARGDGVGSPFYSSAESERVPSGLFSVSECILVLPILFFPVSVATLSLIYKFILPILLFVLVYLFIWRLTNRRIWSLAGSSLAIIGTQLISISDIVSIISFKFNYGQFMHYYRPVNPQFSSLFLFGFLHLYLSAIRKKTLCWYLFGGIVFGLTFYIYFYTWTFLLAFLVISSFVWMINKKFYVSVSKNIYTVLTGLLLGVYSLYQLYLLNIHPFFGAIADDYDLAYSHMPIVSMAGIVVTILFAVYFIKQKVKTKEDYLVLTLLLTAFAVINQQVITGFLLQSGHYHWYFNTPIYFITAIYVASKTIRDLVSRKWEIVMGIFIVLLSVYVGIFVQYSSYTRNINLTSINQDYKEVFTWLENNAQTDSTVFASQSVSELVPVFTKCCYVAYEVHGVFYLLSQERRSYDEAKILQSLKEGQKIPFSIDYIVWNRESEPEWEIDKLIKAKKEVDFGRLEVYRLQLKNL